MAFESLISDGRLSVPLFHGTSTLFYDSILNAGLGGRNMIEDLGLRPVVRSLVQLCEKELEPDEQWVLDKSAAMKISAEPDDKDLRSNTGFNFRYGGTYLSASRYTAVQYALLYDCGSEALSYSLRLFNRLAQQRPALAAREEFSKISELGRKLREPLLVEAINVETACLRAEQGGPCGPVFEQIEDALAEPDICDVLIQQANFELLGPLPPESLKFFRIVRRNPHERLGPYDSVPL